MRASLTALVAVAVGFMGVACDSSGSTPDDGPLTTCAYSFTKGTGTKAFGQACTQDSDCEFVCIMPGAAGNTTNEKFGFCTRGCDCNNDESSRLTSEQKTTLTCLYPYGDQGANRHVAVRCSTVADCTAVDPGWTECNMPGVGVNKTCLAK